MELGLQSVTKSSLPVAESFIPLTSNRPEHFLRKRLSQSLFGSSQQEIENHSQDREKENQKDPKHLFPDRQFAANGINDRGDIKKNNQRGQN
jgi:hypothetical protein